MFRINHKYLAIDNNKKKQTDYNNRHIQNIYKLYN